MYKSRREHQKVYANARVTPLQLVRSAPLAEQGAQGGDAGGGRQWRPVCRWHARPLPGGRHQLPGSAAGGRSRLRHRRRRQIGHYRDPVAPAGERRHDAGQPLRQLAHRGAGDRTARRQAADVAQPALHAADAQQPLGRRNAAPNLNACLCAASTQAGGWRKPTRCWRSTSFRMPDNPSSSTVKLVP